MSTSQTRSYGHWHEVSNPYWLPPHGIGNGRTARAWAPIADLSELEAFEMLSTCGDVGIAAFISPRDGGRPTARPVVYRTWVDSEHFGAAEDALRHAVIEVRARKRTGSGGVSGEVGDGAAPVRSRAGRQSGSLVPKHGALHRRRDRWRTLRSAGGPHRHLARQRTGDAPPWRSL